MKKKVHKLVSEQEGKSFFIGIVSHENDYRLVWAFNQKLNFRFVKSNDLTINQPKLEQEQIFSVFSYDDEERFVKFNLIANKTENGFLVSENKNVDFILKISGEINEGFIPNLLKEIKALEFVSTAFVLEKLSPKSTKNMFF